MSDTATGATVGFVEDLGKNLSSRLFEMGIVFGLLLCIIVILIGVIIWGIRKRDKEQAQNRADVDAAILATKEANDQLVDELRNQLSSHAQVFSDFQRLAEAVASASKLMDEVSKGYQASLRDLASRNRS